MLASAGSGIIRSIISPAGAKPSPSVVLADRNGVRTEALVDEMARLGKLAYGE
jgi:hypothetical protein